MTKEDAIKVLSVLHLGYDIRVKEACELGIKALMKDIASETSDKRGKHNE